MQLAEIMSPSLVLPELEATTREDVLEELVDRLFEAHGGFDRDLALRVLLHRERLGSTGVGNGIAIPHAKLPNLPRAVACFARSKRGVDFSSVDGRPAYLFLLLIAPEGHPGLHLKTLARASRLFRDPEFREALMQGEDAESLWTVINEQDAMLEASGIHVRPA